jgi:hypothetical protein
MAFKNAMLEFLHNFESAAGTAQLSPLALVGTGLAAVLVGLFVWLGGLGYRKILFGVAGAVSGGILGFLVAGRSIISAMVLAPMAATTATVFERLFFTILAAALASVFAFLVLARPYMEDSQPGTPPGPDKTPAQAKTMSVGESMERVKAYLADAGRKTTAACSRMSVFRWGIIVALAIIAIAAGFHFRRLTAALCCSVLGTMLVFAGMISLLLHKGAAPVSSIRARPSFYAAVFMALAAFGTIEQLLLCKPAQAQSEKKKQAGNDEQGAKSKRRSWRTS